MTPGTDYSLANEATIVTEHAMSYINIPVVYTDPTMDDLRLFIKTMRALDDKKVWVHCALNARVSAFMYHYLKHEERRGDAEARTTYLNKFQPDMPPAWHKFLEYNETEIGLW
jgi:protein tyrosine phosphatase (PTP) superfamily phosphohydrolase (DUF442 family)